MGRIFDIKKYAIHDGPSIRTTVFFKGCPLACAWCHNPEGISATIERIWIKDRCAGCGQCIEECSTGALHLQNDRVTRDKGACAGCGHCVDVCPALAHEATGRKMEVKQVMAEIKKDIPFYDQSGGGVTFSGGDPLFQPEFLVDLLNACKTLGIHRAVDTAAHTKTDLLGTIADLTDLFLIDIKHMDSDTHKKFTGISNRLILENIRFIAGKNKKIRFRVPLIDGVNSDVNNIENTGRFIAGVAPKSRVDLLPYHEMAASKYDKLGISIPPQSFEKPDKALLNRCDEQLARFGLKTTVGG